MGTRALPFLQAALKGALGKKAEKNAVGPRQPHPPRQICKLCVLPPQVAGGEAGERRQIRDHRAVRRASVSVPRIAGGKRDRALCGRTEHARHALHRRKAERVGQNHDVAFPPLGGRSGGMAGDPNAFVPVTEAFGIEHLKNFNKS